MNSELDALIEERKELLILYSKGKGYQKELDEQITFLSREINRIKREINHGLRIK